MPERSTNSSHPASSPSGNNERRRQRTNDVFASLYPDSNETRENADPWQAEIETCDEQLTSVTQAIPSLILILATSGSDTRPSYQELLLEAMMAKPYLEGKRDYARFRSKLARTKFSEEDGRNLLEMCYASTRLTNSDGSAVDYGIRFPTEAKDASWWHMYKKYGESSNNESVAPQMMDSQNRNAAAAQACIERINGDPEAVPRVTALSCALNSMTFDS